MEKKVKEKSMIILISNTHNKNHIKHIQSIIMDILIQIKLKIIRLISSIIIGSLVKIKLILKEMVKVCIKKFTS